MNKSLIVVTTTLSLLYSIHQPCIGQVATSQELPDYKDIIYLKNIYADGSNPCSFSFTPIRDYLNISLSSDFDRGSYHAVDGSDKTNNLGFDISGMTTVNQISCYGSLSYLNQKAYERRWNSTLFIAEENPFILGDSIQSDFNTEKFHLQGGVSFQPVARLFAALDLQYMVGSSANQTDPRPKTDGMHFIIKPGILYQCSESFSLGVSGSFDLMNESLTHTLINSQYAYTYFRFNGMGCYNGVGTGTLQTYPRSYKGNKYTGALQAVYAGGSAMTNFAEIGYSSQWEDARDGGRTFTFLGGDFRKKEYHLTDRFRISAGQVNHNITLDARFCQTEGDWYEQTEFLDPEKDNQLSYKVQDVNLIHKEQSQVVGVTYQFDKLTRELPSTTLLFEAKYKNSDLKHFEGDGYFQKYSNLSFQLNGTQRLRVGDKHFFSFSAGVRYRLPLSDSMEAKAKLYEDYTAVQFEYLTSACYGGTLNCTYQYRINNWWMGVYARANSIWYGGDNKYSDAFHKQSAQYYQAGLTLTF